MLSKLVVRVVSSIHTLKERDVDDVRNSLEKELREHQFISYQRLEEIINEDNIVLQLNNPEKEVAKHVASSAASKALKLFSILVLLNKQAYFQALFENCVDDNIFTGQWRGEILSSGLDSKGKILSSKKTLIDFPAVVPKNLQIDLSKNQWKIPPPFLKDRTMEFPSAYIPPFYKSTSLGSGGYGEVEKVIMGGGHVRGYPMTTEGVVVKRIVMSKDERSDFLREPTTLYARKHHNIVPLLASFITSDEDDEDSLHLLQPYAVGGDMENWLTSESTPEKPRFLETHPDILPEFLYESITEIVSALAYVHSTIDGHWTGHWDLKPSNILLFFENDRWIWKLADFGHSHLKARDSIFRDFRGVGSPMFQSFDHSHRQTVEDTPGTHRIMGSFEYQPPEYGISRYPKFMSFDVFPMGCIIVELATMMVFNDWSNNQVSKFRELRLQNDHPSKENERVLDSSFRNNLHVVMEWIEHLEERNNDTKLQRLLGIARDMMAVAPRDRLLSFDAALDCWELTHRENSDLEFESVCKNTVKGQGPIDRKFGPCYDPVLRSKSRDPMLGQARARIRQECLMGVGWPGTGVAGQYREHVGPPRSGASFSSLPNSFHNDVLYGREHQLAALNWMFNYDGARHVGIYGLGGMGKSHVAWTCVSRFREKFYGQIFHTFWIQAQNRLVVEDGLIDIARQIGFQNTLGQWTAAEAKQWLEDSNNGPWILILDGMEQNDPEWSSLIPWNEGKILITTKDRSVASRYCGVNIVEIGPLEKKHAGRLLTNVSGDISPRAEALAEKLCLPIIIKITGRFIHQDKLGGRSIDSMDKEIQASVHLPDFATGKELSQAWYKNLNPGTKTIWDLLFKPLEIEDYYHDAFRVMCFFSGHDIDKRILAAKDFGAEWQMKIYSGLANLSFLIPVTDQQFRIHEAIQAMFLRWLYDRKGGKDIWMGYLRAIDRVHDHYRAQKNKCSDQVPLYLLKLRCKVHVENFLRYIKLNTNLKLPYYKNAAVSVISFAAWLREERRYEDSEVLLRHILERGILNDRGRQKLLDTHLALVETYRASASGRSGPEKLNQALNQAEEAVQQAVEAQNLFSQRRLCAIRIHVLHDMQDYKGAERHLRALETIQTGSREEDQKALIQHLELQALISRSIGGDQWQIEPLLRAREIWKSLEEEVANSSYSRQDKVEKKKNVLKNDAKTCTIILKVLTRLETAGESLDENTRELGHNAKFDANQICTKIHEETQIAYTNENQRLAEHKHVSDAWADMGAVNLMYGIWLKDSAYVEDSIKSFRKALDSYRNISKLDVKDKSCRQCAYNLRGALVFLAKSEPNQLNHAQELLQLDAEFNLIATDGDVNYFLES